jgi:hypothetical protein
MNLSRTIRSWTISALVCTAVALPTLPADEPGPVLETVRERSPGASEEHVLLDTMNPFILTNLVSSRVVVEIDRVAGYEPSPQALRAVERVLADHCESGKRVDVVLDDEIPREVWEKAAGRSGLEGLVARYLDRDPTDWAHVEVVYVVYAPDSRPWYGRSVSGMTDRITFSRGGAVATVRTILLFTDEIRRDALLWITPAKVERAVLVHELGHVIGLVGDPGHMQPEQPGHCSVARCVMHQPGKRAGFVNGLPALLAGRIPSRYGKRCGEDIETAKRLWRERAAAAPEVVRRLKAERLFRESRIPEAGRSHRESM